MKANEHAAGYRIEKVFVADQEYRLIADEEFRDSTDPGDRIVNFAWDWRPVSPRRFEVIIAVTVDPIRLAPERASVRIIGIFAAEEGKLSIAFADFLQVNAPAILFPYAREVISTMTGRGPHGAFHLNPLNVPSLLAGFDLEKTSGYQYLKENASVAADFELDLKQRPVAAGA